MPPRIGCIAWAVCMLAPICCAQTEMYEDPEGRFSFAVPDGWQQAPQAQIDYLNELVNTREPGKNYKFILAFSPKANIFNYPYLLLQETAADTSRTTYNELAAAFNANLIDTALEDAADIWGDLLDSASTSSAIVEPDSNSFRMTFQLQTQTSQPIRGFSFGKFTNTGMYQLNAYVLADDLAESKHLVDVAQSLTIDPSIAFVPSQPGRSVQSPDGISKAAGILVVGAIAVIGFGPVIIFVIWKLSRSG